MVHNRRKRCFVDRRVQGALTYRAVLYVVLILLATSLLTALCVSVMEGPFNRIELARHMWSRFGPAWVASILMIPLVVIDCIRLTNRFAGPMLRLRHAMKQAAEGREVAPVRFRKGDFWHDFAEDFNRYLALRASTGDESQSVEETGRNGEETGADLILMNRR